MRTYRVYSVRYRTSKGAGEIYAMAVSADHAICIAKQPLLNEFGNGSITWFEILSSEPAMR